MAMFKDKLKQGFKKKRLEECPKSNQKLRLNYQDLHLKKVDILNN